MTTVKVTRRRIHANCGGEIEYVFKLNQTKTLVSCKKCKMKEIKRLLDK